MPDDPTPTPVLDPDPTPEPEPAPEFRPVTSQEEFDRRLAHRLQRERAKFADYDDLKAKATKLAEIEAESLSELEKERAQREKAEKASAKAVETANERLIRAEVLAEATRQKALKPEHLHKLIERGDVTVGDDGEVAGVADAVGAFLEANPEYVGTTRAAGSADLGARGGGDKPAQLTRDDIKDMSPAEMEKADQEGRLDQLLRGAA